MADTVHSDTQGKEETGESVLAERHDTGLHESEFTVSGIEKIGEIVCGPRRSGERGQVYPDVAKPGIAKARKAVLGSLRGDI